MSADSRNLLSAAWRCLRARYVGALASGGNGSVVVIPRQQRCLLLSGLSDSIQEACWISGAERAKNVHCAGDLRVCGLIKRQRGDVRCRAGSAAFCTGISRPGLPPRFEVGRFSICRDRFCRLPRVERSARAAASPLIRGSPHATLPKQKKPRHMPGLLPSTKWAAAAGAASDVAEAVAQPQAVHARLAQRRELQSGLQ